MLADGKHGTHDWTNGALTELRQPPAVTSTMASDNALSLPPYALTNVCCAVTLISPPAMGLQLRVVQINSADLNPHSSLPLMRRA